MNNELTPQEKTVRNLDSWDNRHLKSLFSAIMKADLPTNGYSLGEQKQLRKLKSVISRFESSKY